MKDAGLTHGGFHAHFDQTGPLRAGGRVLTMRRRAAFAEAVLSDAGGRLLASATSTLLVMDA